MNDFEQFLEEFSALSRKYKIRVGGCGCCGSPWIEREEKFFSYGCVDQPPGNESSIFFKEENK